METGVEKDSNWNENLLEDLNIKSELAEERISKHEDKSIEIKQSKEQRENRMKKNETEL